MEIKHSDTSKKAVIILLLAISSASCDSTVKHDLIIAHINIINVKTGEVTENQTVAIDSNRIAAIYAKEVRTADSTKVIDGRGKYLIPGLWDMHTHYNWNHTYADPLLIANGVTGVREMWGDVSVINDVRKKTKEGLIIAPDIYTSGAVIDGKPPFWPGSVSVATPEEARNAVVQQIHEGVDFIKVYSFLTEDCFMAIADAANENKMPFAGHVPAAVSIYKAIDAGMASSEHLMGILEECSSKKDSILRLSLFQRIKPLVETFKEEKFDSLCDVLVMSKMWLCPTLTVNRAIGYLRDTSFTNDKRLAYLPASMRSGWNPDDHPTLSKANEDFFATLRSKYHLQMSMVGKMNKKGVKFLAGTDYPNPYVFPGFSLHDELSLLVASGMSELDALKTATINPAIFMGKEDKFGTVEAGKLASLVLLNKNPLDDIENSKSIDAVILRGKVFDRTSLDEMLEKAKINAAMIPSHIDSTGNLK